MLLVKTYLDKSPIHGIGLFAKEFIPKGTKVWEYNGIIDRILTKNDLDSLKKIIHKDIFNHLRNHISKISGDIFMFYGDDSKFINHSSTPNVIEKSIYVSFSSTDIISGEEITENYLNTYFNEDIKFLKVKK